MKKYKKSLIVLLVFFLSSILFFLPTVLFDKSQSKESVIHTQLELPRNETTEKLLLEVADINRNGDAALSSSQILLLGKLSKELKKVFRLFSIPEESLVIVNYQIDVVSNNIFWLIDFASPDGNGNALIEDKTEKVMQFRYFPQEQLPSLDGEQVIQNYFDYLDVAIKKLTKDKEMYDVQLTDDSIFHAMIDDSRIILNIP